MARPSNSDAGVGIMMNRIKWIKDLVIAEQHMEETGMVDFTAGFDPESSLEEQTIEYLRDLKTAFIETASAFNELKGSGLGTLKIYGISKTKADFMLFRNGFKLIFSMSRPGAVSIRFNHIGAAFIPGVTQDPQEIKPPDEDWLKAKWGAFGDLVWTYKEQEVKLDYMVRYYITRFVRESAK